MLPGQRWIGLGVAIACILLCMWILLSATTAFVRLDSPLSHANFSVKSSPPVEPESSHGKPHSLLTSVPAMNWWTEATSSPSRARAELWHFANSKARLAHTTELKVAVSITGQGADLMQRWQPTIDYLNTELGDYTFSLLPMQDNTMKEAVKLGQVDFVIPHSGLYIELESRFDVNRIATFRNVLNDEAYSVFGSVIFTRSDRHDIHHLSDLRDKTVVAVRDNTVGDWLGVERELVERSITPAKDLADLRFMGDVRRVMAEVRRGEADVGVLRADQLRLLEQRGHLTPNQFKVLNPRTLPQYPLQISTRLYPEIPFAALNHVPQEVVQRVAIALLSIAPDSEAATQLNSAGWSIPLSYRPVNDVYRRLRIGPYEPSGFDLRAVLWHYKRWIFTIACLLIMGAATIYIQRREIIRRRRSELALQTSQDELQQRTFELEQTLSRLQSTQAQLIQTEKMSSLGQLMAGVAHEINNPVNFIHGNVHHASEYTRDILQLLKLYQETYPHHSCEIRDLEAEIDIAFVCEDLPKLLSSMQLGSERIREIIQSLRVFSRVDEADLKAVDLHKGIDSTLLILQHRLKAKHNRPAIRVIKQYGALPAVECYAGQLNQVFMNILSNAIDALEEQCENPATIWIETSVADKNCARIVFKNNGPPISEAIQHKLFNPFFTTKPVGKGTGLGMSISYQIVTEKHGGTLRCHSSPGNGVAFIIDIPISHSIDACTHSISKGQAQPSNIHSPQSRRLNPQDNRHYSHPSDAASEPAPSHKHPSGV